MDARINEGYVITDSIHVGETEFVFGKLDSKIPMYVTWACKGVSQQNKGRENSKKRAD